MMESVTAEFVHRSVKKNNNSGSVAWWLGLFICLSPIILIMQYQMACSWITLTFHPEQNYLLYSVLTDKFKSVFSSCTVCPNKAWGKCFILELV